MVTSTQCVKKYGLPYDDTQTTVNENTAFESKHMTLLNIPVDIRGQIPALPARIYMNKDMVKPFLEGLRNVISRGLQGEIKTFDGCFQIRNKRGLSSLSLHSWAIAFDMNASWNQLGKEPTMSPQLVKCFTDAGFDWGGLWRRKDGMHFQLSKI